MPTPEQLDRQMHEVLREHHRVMHQHFKECGLFNGEPMMLFLIGEGEGLTQRELAERMHITPASVTVSVRRLVGEALVERRPDAADARRLHLYLTEQGRQLNAACLRVRDEMIRLVYGSYTPEERDQMGALLDKMQENLVLARRQLTKGEEPV